MLEAATTPREPWRPLYWRDTALAIGGSLALALKKQVPAVRIIGCDREPVLKEALETGAIDDGSSIPGQAVRPLVPDAFLH